MARITVEDCVTQVPNRFDLVLYAAQRARQISAGAPLLVERDNDKNPVVSLREVAEQHVTPENLRESVISSLQKQVERDEPVEEDIDLSTATHEGLMAASSGERLVEQEISDEMLTVGEEEVEAGAGEAGLSVDEGSTPQNEDQSEDQNQE
jgi:DNA-directed RNA polymerase subunit omega